MKYDNSAESHGNEKEILLHLKGVLIPGKRPFMYHEFSVPEYTVSIQIFLEGSNGRLFLAIFDPEGVRGSGVGRFESEKGLIDLKIEVPGTASPSERYLARGTWKALVECDDLRETASYALSVWYELDKTAFMYPWLKPGLPGGRQPGVSSP